MKIKYNSLWQVLNSSNSIEDKYNVMEKIVDGLVYQSLEEGKKKDISNCTKANCKGQKVRTLNPKGYVCDTCELPKLIEANKPPRTGRVEKKGDREKLEKVLKKINKKK